jgi:hypothetical protein
MVGFRRIILPSLLVALLLPPSGAGAAPGKGGGGVDETPVWNQVMLDAIVAGTLGNPQALRMAATVNTAMFDARNGVSRAHTPIVVTQTAPPGTHRRAAVVQAADVTLKAFYPAQQARFDQQRALSLTPSSRDLRGGPSSPAATGESRTWREKASTLAPGAA